MPKLALYFQETGHTIADLARFVSEERKYMAAPQEEPPQLQQQVDYVHSLRLLDNAM